MKSCNQHLTLLASLFLLLLPIHLTHAQPVLSVKPAGHQGFDVWVGGKLVAPIRLSTNGIITASQVQSTAHSLRLSGLRCKDPQAATFAPDDFVSVTWPPPALPHPTSAKTTTLSNAPSEPQVRFKLSLRHFNAQHWQALLPGGKAPFHFLSCSMPTAQVWHQRGWLNATPNADPFPLLGDVHLQAPEISSLWNRNWSYICPLGAHPIPMIGVWDPAQRLYVGYDFQEARATDQSERYVSTAYCWQQGKDKSFITLAFPYGGLRYGELIYPKSGDVVASHFRLIIDTNLPDTEDPNERFQTRLFAHYQDALPRVPAMNDLSWLPGGVRLQDFVGPQSLDLYGPGMESTFYLPGTLIMRGWTGHREMPIDTAARRGDNAAIEQARTAIASLLHQYAKHVTVNGEECLFWEKPLEGAWRPEWGGAPVRTLHNTDAWYAARVLVELYRYDRAHGHDNPEYLQAIDGIFNWAKHFVWTRNEFPDVPSSPFAIGGTLSIAFLLDYYFTFKDDAQRGTNAQLALKLADHITWRYLPVWAMDSDRADGLLDSSFLLEPNSGRDWAGLACANEMFWVIDTLTQVYVHTGDARMRYYLRGILQRWPALYRPEYEDKITEYGPGSMTEGLGLFDGAGPGRGGRYNYGNADSLPLNEPVGNSKLRIVAGANAAIAFCKDGTHSDLADYQTDGKGACSFRIVSTLKDEFDVSFSYPYVDISQLPVYLQRNGQLQALTAAAVRHPPQALSSLYLSRLRNGDTIFIGAANLARHPINITIPLTYKDNDDVSKYSGVSSDFDIIPLSSTSSRKLSQDWNDLASFAGLAQGLHWTYGVPYFQKSYTGGITTKISGARAIFLFYAPKSIDVVGAPPHLVLDNGQTIRLSGQAAPAWRGWPPSFQRVVLMDYALIPSGHTVQQVVATAGNQLMGVTAFRGRMTDLQTTLHAMGAAATIYQQERNNLRLLVTFKSSLPSLAPGPIAILPGVMAGSASNFMALTGLRAKSIPITAPQLIDPQQFNAQRFPVAFYLGGERYIKTVLETGDAQAAIIRYLAEGGTLIVLGSQPYPLFYGDRINGQTGPPDPLFAKIGLPLSMAFETAPTTLHMLRAPDQQIMQAVPESFPFPSGDPRLRATTRALVDPANRYTPLISVQDAHGKDYGDAAFYIEFGTGPAKGGKLLYIWPTLLDSPQGNKIMGDAVAWALKHAAH